MTSPTEPSGKPKTRQTINQAAAQVSGQAPQASRRIQSANRKVIPASHDSRQVISRAAEIVSRLHARYPDARCTLDYTSPWQLLIAAILAAQCTDARVNRITAVLFVRYPDLSALAAASQEEIETIIRSCGLYHNKAKAIRLCSQMLVERYNGAVPADLDILLSLPGVGRKIANLILGDSFGIPGMVVDTHCARISRLLGLTGQHDPGLIEQDLIRIVAHDQWTSWGHLMVAHGREICQARCRQCARCPIRLLCDYGRSVPLQEDGDDHAGY